MKKRGTDAATESKIVVKDGAFHFEQVPKWKVPHTFHKSETFMDYLHGDVAQREAFLACQYEYARESPSFWKAAQKRDECLAEGQGIEHAANAGYHEAGMSLPHFALEILYCPSFPKKDWQELTEDERRGIRRFYPSGKIQPLTMPEVPYLKALGIFRMFEEMKEEAKPVIENAPPKQWPPPKKKPFLPILQRFELRPYFHVVFQIDFSKGETQLKNEFFEWLLLPDNQARFAKFKKSTVGKTGKPLDRLKDLAAWRLYREMGAMDAANKFAHEHRKALAEKEIAKKYKNKTAEQRRRIKAGSGKPFRDAKSQAQGTIPANEADLFWEEADTYRAEASAREYLTEIIPDDFPSRPGPEMQAAYARLDKLASKA